MFQRCLSLVLAAAILHLSAAPAHADDQPSAAKARNAGTGRTMTVAYADIADVKTGRPEWVNLLIFVGAAIGTLTAITWIALVVADPH